MKGCRGLWLLGGKQSAMAAQWGPGWEGMVTIAKEALHRLIDELPDDQAERLLRCISDLVLQARALAPLDDEPETPEEAAAVAEGIADLERGDVLTTEQLRRELGL